MKVYIASDHAGYILKEELFNYLVSLNIDAYNLGCDSTNSVDYPDYASKVAKEVQKGDALGILVCYTGIGMSITANKYKGIRASLVGKLEDAILTREHNDANILCLSAKNTNELDAKKIVKAFLDTKFLGERHLRRVNKIKLIEDEERKGL